jgi:hypothetical protein
MAIVFPKSIRRPFYLFPDNGAATELFRLLFGQTVKLDTAGKNLFPKIFKIFLPELINHLYSDRSLNETIC